MKRRDLIAGLGFAAAWPLIARAQSDRMRRVGVYVLGDAPPARDLAIVRELERLGYVEGRNVAYVVRGIDERAPAELEQAAHELVATRPDILVGPGTTFAYTLAKVTHDIPIVVTATADPVTTGLSTSMSRPTRNVTGFTISAPSMVSKRLEILRQLLPGVRKVGRLWVPTSTLAGPLTQEAQNAAAVLGIDLVSLPVASGADLSVAFAFVDKEHLSAIISDPDPVGIQFSATIADECRIRDLPWMGAWAGQVRNGALIAYGPATVENLKGAANYVDRLLKGATVADLPFQEPTELHLTINLATARSIGVTVPPNLLALADEVVE